MAEFFIHKVTEMMDTIGGVARMAAVYPPENSFESTSSSISC